MLEEQWESTSNGDERVPETWSLSLVKCETVYITKKSKSTEFKKKHGVGTRSSTLLR
jgi:hypothetical protein